MYILPACNPGFNYVAAAHDCTDSIRCTFLLEKCSKTIRTFSMFFKHYSREVISNYAPEARWVVC